MRKLLASLTLSVIGLAGCSVGESKLLNSDNPPTSSMPDTHQTQQASTCDNAREALLTGSDTEINATFAALVADRSADANAREAAAEYLTDDGPYADPAFWADMVKLNCEMTS